MNVNLQIYEHSVCVVVDLSKILCGVWMQTLEL